MESFEAFMRAEIDALQYAAFFGLLILLGIIEAVIGQRASGSDRRRRWPSNFGLTALNIVVLGALPISGVAAADWARDHGIGLLNMVAVTPVAALVLGILLRSLVSWGVHLAMHKVPLLWRVHRVHHSDPHLDVSTTVRFHPLEFLISTPVLVTAILALGLNPVALLVYEVFDAAMAVFTHANLRLPRVVDRALSWVLVTPDMHRIHHSAHQPETDSNYGATLSLWDRLFGTFRQKDAPALAVMDIGLAEYRDGRAASFLWLLKLPFLREAVR